MSDSADSHVFFFMSNLMPARGVGRGNIKSMKKQLKWALLLFVAALTSVSLTACSDDDKDEPASGDAAKFAGIWYDHAEFGDAMKLNADGTGVSYALHPAIDSFDIIWEYDKNKKTLTLIYTDDYKEVYTVLSISDQELIVLDKKYTRCVYTKHDDLSFLGDYNH